MFLQSYPLLSPSFIPMGDSEGDRPFGSFKERESYYLTGQTTSLVAASSGYTVLGSPFCHWIMVG